MSEEEKSHRVEKTVQRFGLRRSIITEIRSHHQQIPAHTMDGSEIFLPFTSYSTTIKGKEWGRIRASKTERGREDAPYDRLSKQEKKAVDFVVNNEEQLLQPAAAEYKRLTIWPDEADGKNHLYTTKHLWREERSRLMFASLDEIDYPVSTATHVSSSYLVTPAPTLETVAKDKLPYIDSTLNFFGPGRDKANAFWISGIPREVVLDPRKSAHVDFFKEHIMFFDGRINRWVPKYIIMPVDFYFLEGWKPPEGEK